MTSYTMNLCGILSLCVLILDGASQSRRIHRKDDFNRIIGGVKAMIQDYPYLVSIRAQMVHFCGGSIISPRYVITAAHCHIAEVKFITVVTGVSNSRENGTVYKTKFFVPHEKYEDLQYDIAIVKIQGSFKFSHNIQPIKLPSPGFSLQPGDELKICGYGKVNLSIVHLLKISIIRLNDDEDLSFLNDDSPLQVASVPYVRRDICQKAFDATSYTITENMICAGKPGVDACQGDSGGGVEYNGLLVGIVSWGIGCGDPKYFGVYTKVSEYIGWIKHQMRTLKSVDC